MDFCYKRDIIAEIKVLGAKLSLLLIHFLKILYNAYFYPFLFIIAERHAYVSIKTVKGLQSSKAYLLVIVPLILKIQISAVPAGEFQLLNV